MTKSIIELETTIVSDGVIKINNRRYIQLNVEHAFHEWLNAQYIKFFKNSYDKTLLWVKLPFRYGRYEKIELMNKDGTAAFSNKLLKNAPVKVQIYNSGIHEDILYFNAVKIIFL